MKGGTQSCELRLAERGAGGHALGRQTATRVARATPDKVSRRLRTVLTAERVKKIGAASTQYRYPIELKGAAPFGAREAQSAQPSASDRYPRAELVVDFTYPLS